MLIYLFLLSAAQACITFDNIKLCSKPTLILCTPNVRPMCSSMRNRTGGGTRVVTCPTCVPKDLLYRFCKVKPTKECVGMALPVPTIKTVGGIKGICPSCIPAYVKPTCTKDMYMKCRSNIDITMKKIETKTTNLVIRKCSMDEVPEQRSCCPTCIPAITICARNGSLAKCVPKWHKLISCKKGERPKIGRDCCRTCKVGKPRKANARCSVVDHRAGVMEAPECGMNETRVTSRQSLTCGPSCRRKSSAFELKDVMKCLKGLKKCDVGVQPEQFTGDRCPSCIKRRPVCMQKCGVMKVCIQRGRKGAKKKAACVMKKKLRMRIKAKTTAFFKELEGMSREDIRSMIQEAVERFCERNDVADKCDRWLSAIRESLNCTKKEKSTLVRETLVVELDVAGESSDTGVKVSRRLLGTSEVSNIVIDSMADQAGLVTTSTDEVSISSATTKTTSFIMLVPLIIHQLMY